jgi:colanic acid/amylovoran biosynthesis glycosyltransferase
MRETAVSLGFQPERVHIVRIAVGHEELHFQPPRPLEGRPPCMVVAGRFVEKKGIALAIRAFALIRKSWPGATLEIIGSGPLEDDLRDAASSVPADGAIMFAGSLERRSYLARLNAADVLLAPSITARNGDSEGGAPTTILDAQAVGTIVVGSTHADIPFLVDDGRTGFLAPEGSLDGLVGAIQRALVSSDEWPEIASAAREAVVMNHDDRTLSASLASVYTDAISR